MAVNSSRSQRLSLLEGTTDGMYRKIRPNTEPNPVDAAETIRSRQHLHPPMNYGYITQEVPLDQRAMPGS